MEEFAIYVAEKDTKKLEDSFEETLAYYDFLSKN